MKILIREEFKQDYISRVAGEKLRNKILNEVSQGNHVHLDFSGLIIASTSFWDEAIAKLTKEGWTFNKLNQWVKLENINPRDIKLMEDLCRHRGMKE